MTRTDAVQSLFQALELAAPDVLRDLHARPRTPAAETTWAAAHRLGAPAIVAFARALRAWWDDHPRQAARGRVMVRVNVECPTDADQAWVAHHQRGDWWLPSPRFETRAAWLTRAGALYDARAAAQGEPPYQPRRSATAQHVRMFVAVQVKGDHPARVAQREGVSRSAVEQAVTQVAAVLGLARVRRRRGGDHRPRAN